MRVMYHVTPASRLPTILHKGLYPQPLSSSAYLITEWTRGTYLEENYEEARHWPDAFIPLGKEKRFALLEVLIPEDAELVPDPEVREVGSPPSAYIYSRSIPPANIKILEYVTGRWD